MKKLLLTALMAVSALGASAQTKSTGVVTLNSSYTVRLDLNSTTSTATLTLAGPSDRWFALQFGSFANGAGMEDGTDVVYYNGTTLIDATQNGIGSPPSPDTNDWTVTSNTTSGTTRTLIATRSFAGGANDYVFNYDDANIDFAWARGSNASFTMSSHGGNRGYQLNRTFSVTAGTDSFSLIGLKAYPNPVSSVVTLSANSGLSGIIVNNMLGQQVLTQKVTGTTAEVNMAQFPVGTYMVKASADNGATATVRVIKQ
jgi:hypothetical protein